MAIVSHGDIEDAARRIAGMARRTPVLRLDEGTTALPGRITLKLDLLQPTGSFKARGAVNLLRSREVPPAGVVAASGGNFGLAVAWAAGRLGHAATIFVPDTSPAAKIARLRSLGATVEVVPGYYADAARAASEQVASTGALEAHPYDDPEVVAGAGTCGMEITADVPDVDTVVVAVGGGGLVAGLASWFRDDVRVVAVETHGTPALHAALAAGRPVDVEVGGVAADSLGARRIGDRCWEVRHWIDESVLVHDDDVRAAQRFLWDETRLIAEPGAATATAALLAGAYLPRPGEEVCIVVCGANTDPSTVTG